jgi:hypothetical protein
VRDLLGLACVPLEERDDVFQHFKCVMLLAQGCLPAQFAVLWTLKFCPQGLHGLFMSVETLPVGNEHVVQFANHAWD